MNGEAVAALVERSKYTVKNGHAWTAVDHGLLVQVVHDLLQAAQRADRRAARPRISKRGLVRLRSRRG